MDSIPASDSKHCRNCEYSLPTDAKYCSNCSQKYTTGKVSIFTFLNEFFAEHLNLDSKLVLTAIALFQPGKLTIEFFKGKHKSYATPLRLFLVTGVLMATILGFNLFKDNTNESPFEDMLKNFQRKIVVSEMDSIIQVKKQEFNQPNIHQAYDSLSVALNASVGDLSDSLDFSESNEDIQLSFNVPKVAVKDLVNLKATDLVDKYGPEFGFWKRLIFIQSIKAFKQGHSFAQFMLNKFSVGILFMMPFLALVLKMLYFRRKKFYVEHLVFSFHFHAFLFLIVSILLIMGNYLPEFLIPITILYTFVYLFLALKKVYQQSWKKTILKYTILYLAYGMLTSIFIILTVIASFLLF